MIRRLLFQRTFKCVPLMFVMGYLLLGLGAFGFAIHHSYLHGRLIQDKAFLRVLPTLVSCFAILAWGIAGILKADICRSSTSMIPGFRRKLLNFFLGFGVIVGTLPFLFLLNPVWDPSWLRHLRIILSLGIFLFGIFLFISHVFPYWISFLGFLGFLGGIRNYPLQFGFLESLSFPLLIISPFIIWRYRTMILKTNEDHRSYRTMSFPGFGTTPWKITKMQASHAGLMSSVRWQFEQILRLCPYRRRLGSRLFPLLIVLRNNIVLLNPLILTLLLIIFSSMPNSLLMLIFPFFAGKIVLSNKMFSGKLLPREIVKPLSRKKLFLWEYLSYYFSLLILLLLSRLSDPLRHYNPLYRWLERREGGDFSASPESSALVAGSFFIISFLVLSIRQTSSLRNSILFLYLGGVLTLALAWLSRIIGIFPIITTFSILTVVFLIIAFRLDCRKDI